MTGRIYLIDKNSELTAMEEAPYDSEDLLQGLIASHPDILAGEQIDSAAPRRWLLVTREMSVPGEEDGAGRWSLDHLFLDQDAIPTLIEVKRSSDTRIRREVVGQMLDYAANAVAYWPVERVQALFEARCESQNLQPEDVLEELLGKEHDADAFWQRVKTNLQAGRIRMVFLSDFIPPELRRIVEFLNDQMDPAEVIAIEVKQFVGNGMKTLVPRVIGTTKPSPTASKSWDETSFVASLQTNRDANVVAAARRCIEWAKAHRLRIWWGKGISDGSFFPIYDLAGGKFFTFGIWTSGKVELQFQHMRVSPFSDLQRRAELLQQISHVTEVTLSEKSVTRRPTFNLELLASPDRLERFLSVFDSALAEVKASELASKSSAM